MLAKRQTDLTVVLEQVHKPHNVAAVVRTCDAVGVHQIHGVWQQGVSFRRGTALGAQKWVRRQAHTDIESAVAHLRAKNMQIVVTHLGDTAIDFRQVDYTQPTAIILGQEKYGATEEAIALADAHIMVPMYGATQSLNVSVASAVVLYEAQRQRQQAGLYDNPRQSIPTHDRNEMLFAALHPTFYRQCVERKLMLPEIGPEGEIQADDDWWQRIKYSTDQADEKCT